MAQEKLRITIDAGTTNARLYLWRGREPLGERRVEVGVRDTAQEGTNRRLKEAVRDGLRELLAEAGLAPAGLDCVVASGMITSDVGLVEIPHLRAPAGLAELAAGMREVLLEDVFERPIRFIPGVKNNLPYVGCDNFEEMDIMRGEETEAMALLSLLPPGKPYILGLPGSHGKYVSLDAQGRITGCLTTMAGELLDVLSKRTILAEAVGGAFASTDVYERELVLLGCRTAAQTGLSRAAFSTRVLRRFAVESGERAACYLLGAVLQGDAAALAGSRAFSADPDAPVVLSGKELFTRALKDVLTESFPERTVVELRPDAAVPLSALGALRICDAAE